MGVASASMNMADAELTADCLINSCYTACDLYIKFHPKNLCNHHTEGKTVFLDLQKEGWDPKSQKELLILVFIHISTKYVGQFPFLQ